MKKVDLPFPQFVFVVATRAALGAGLGLLAAGRLRSRERRRLGTILLAVGVLTTIPAALMLFGPRPEPDSPEGGLIGIRVLPRVLLLAAVLLPACGTYADPVAVRHPEGLVHGFLSLETLDGRRLADGELIQTSKAGRVTSRLVFRFVDGSLHDETVVFSQRGRFRMLRDHLIQKGPAFPHPLEAEIDGTTGNVVVRSWDADGKEKRFAWHFDLPPDVSNGLILTLLKNIPPNAARTTVSMLAGTPKPRPVTLVIAPAGEDEFTTGGTHRKAVHFVVHIEIGGIAGAVAPLVGKQPPDTHVWVLEGDAPAFVKSEGPLAMDAEPWRIQLVSPVWSK